MAKPGRNDPCPCGSGQKYKRCCLAKDQEAEITARKAATETRASDARQSADDEDPTAPRCGSCGDLMEDITDELTRDSNAVIDLVHEGKLDEAEQAARALIERYTVVHDGYDRLGMVYEARGDHKAAADCYRKVIEFVKAHPDQYEPTFTVTFQQMIDELDPPAPT
jgi:tetratricopeptide (TPR) repeat protein